MGRAPTVSSSSASSEIVPVPRSQQRSSRSQSMSKDNDDQWLQTFRELDVNGDGKLSVEEVSRILAVMTKGEPSSRLQQEAEQMVAEADQNGDGFVDLQEFLELGARITGMDFDYRNEGIVDGHLSAAYDGDEEDRLLADTFHVFDCDGDGRITAEELHSVLSLLDVGDSAKTTSLVTCRRIINAINTDGSGYIDFKQFKRMMSA